MDLIRSNVGKVETWVGYECRKRRGGNVEKYVGYEDQKWRRPKVEKYKN